MSVSCTASLFGSGVYGYTVKDVRLDADASRANGGQLKKIALVPFDNHSGKRDAANIVASIFVSEIFKSGRYAVEEPGNIRQFFIQERMDSLGELELNNLKMIGKRLKVDGVIVGTVEEYEDGRRGTPYVALNARLVESSSGRVVWYAQHKRSGDEYRYIFEFGDVRSAPELARKVVNEMIETLEW